MATPNDTPDNIPEYGILALIDIVNYTGQNAKLGDQAAAQFTLHFQKEACAIIERQGFTVLKFLGDAVLFWGNVASVRAFVEVALDFFARKRIPGKYGFEARLRMVAHAGFFTLVFNDKREVVDVMGSNAIMTFRLEKKAEAEEVIVTDALFKGIEVMLRKANFMTFQEASTEPLKGLEMFGNPLCYRLIPPCLDDDKETYTTADVYRQKREALFDTVRQIPIFANLYPPIDMDENFINLCLHKDWKESGAKKGREEARFSKNMDMFRDSIELREYQDARGSAGDAISAKELFRRFNKGLILGLPGAGKTTILRHFAYTCLSGDRDAMLLLVNCREIPVNKPVPEVISSDEALRILIRAFLYPSSPCDSDEEKRHVEHTWTTFREAWKAGKAVVLIDALDESPTPGITEMLLSITATLMETIKTAAKQGSGDTAEDQTPGGENRVFLSSRPGEFPAMYPSGEPVFYVQPINMEDMRAMARSFYGEASEVYARFDKAIWRHSWIKRLAGTPLTTLLLLVYFQARGKFNHRFPTYDLLLKFILNQTWEKLKRGDYKKSLLNPGYFIEEADKDDFFEKKPDIRSQYDMLSLLSYETLYGSEAAQAAEATTTKRSLSKAELQNHFLGWLEEEGKRGVAWLKGLAEGKIKEKADKWLDIFKKEHLLISAGYERYLFIHSTVMEFLAARYLRTQLGKDKRILRKEVASMISTRERQGLETLPMCCGRDYTDGFLLLSLLKDHFHQDPPFSLKSPQQGDKKGAHAISTIPFRCLAETEAAEKTSLDALTITRLRNAEENRIKRGNDAKGWVYEGLVKILQKSPEEGLKGDVEGCAPLIPLCREVFTGQYLQLKDVSSLTPAQQAFLTAIVDEDVIRQLKSERFEMERLEAIKKRVLKVLTIDTQAYSPHDKNFSYYRRFTGNVLTGFYGSPNLKHSGGVCKAVYGPDGKTILSASSDNTVKMWDMETGKERATIRLPWVPLKISFSPTPPSAFITANANGTVTSFTFEK